MFGIPGEKKITVDDMREKLSRYDDINADVLRSNLVYFLQQITPLCDALGLELAIHPDDPPIDILGLPRIVKNLEDVEFIINAVPNKSNGVCFCTGSFGANPNNDLPAMAKALGSRVHFIHLRNTRRDADGNFFEDDHLGGNTDMYAVMKELLKIQQDAPNQISFRPDHGHQMIDDLKKSHQPRLLLHRKIEGIGRTARIAIGNFEKWTLMKWLQRQLY